MIINENNQVPYDGATWNGLAQEIAEANTLDLFKSKLAH